MRLLTLGTLSVYLFTCQFAFTGTASALTSSDIKKIQLNTYQYGNDAVPSCFDGLGEIKGEGKGGELVWSFFKLAGFSDVITAAIYGNIQQESSFDPTIMQIGGNSKNPKDAKNLGWGLVQWSPGKKVLDQKQRFNIGGDIWDPNVQLNIILNEMQTLSPVGKKNISEIMKQKFKTNNQIAEAVEFFRVNYEGGTPGSRLKYAKAALNATHKTPSSDGNSSTQSICAGIGGKGKFTDNNSVQYKGLAEALARAKSLAVPGSSAFRQVCGSSCYNRCDHLAAGVWGHSNSGYSTAYVHWMSLVKQGLAHPGDRNPPIGASLFYATGSPYGHIATYLGNNTILSNDFNDRKTGRHGGVYIDSASSMESGPWRLRYLGWGPPVFAGVNHGR